jgi:pilus assembly protein CpaB
MNVMRIAILGVAAIAAGAAALLVRGMLGGGTPATQAAAPPVAITTDVLVASRDVVPGHVLSVDLVRWDSWPKNAVSSTLITKDKQPDIAKAVEGAVVRSPLVAGQPITDASIVRAGSAGFMAATIKPGMRAVSVPVVAETSAGGFILPNDRVDVLLTRDLSAGTGGAKNIVSGTVLEDVRVLAVDQVAHQEKDQQTVVGKTATLELTPAQAELLAQSQQSGTLSLALRALGDSEGEPVAKGTLHRQPLVGGGGNGGANSDRNGVTVFRYGLPGSGSPAGASSGGSNSGATVVASNNGGEPASGSAPTPAPITNPITVTTTNVPIGVPQ